MFKLIIRKEGFESKLQALESPDSDKRAKSYTKTKIGSEIAIRKITVKIRRKRKTTNRIFFKQHGKRGSGEPRAARNSGGGGG